MKLSVIVVVLVCASSTYALDCLQGDLATAAKNTTKATACANGTTDCKGPKFTKYTGYATGVDFACGKCDNGTEGCVDSEKTIAYVSKNFKCHNWKYDETAKYFELQNTTTDCPYQEDADIKCKKPAKDDDKTSKTATTPCGPCAEDAKKCYECKGEKCNGAGALIVYLTPLLAVLYILMQGKWPKH